MKKTSNKLDSLCDHLLNTIEQLQNSQNQSQEEQKILIDRAKTIAACGSVITNAAKEQNKYIELKLKAMQMPAVDVNFNSNLLEPFKD